MIVKLSLSSFHVALPALQCLANFRHTFAALGPAACQPKHIAHRAHTAGNGPFQLLVVDGVAQANNHAPWLMRTILNCNNNFHFA